jgi:adenosine deaminase
MLLQSMPEGDSVTEVTDARTGDAALVEFVRRLPKAELHLHIEGTLEPGLLLELGRRNGVELPCSTAEECRAQYRFRDLRHFLDIYYKGVAVLVTEQDFFDLTTAYVRRVAADGARHVEVFFDPQSHVPRGVPFGTVVGGMTRALREGEGEYGISWRLIMCFLRDRPAAEALEMLELAKPYRDVIAGVGLDSAEVGHPPAAFAKVYEKARAAGFVAVAHAGEEGPPAYITDALDVLGVRRIDHGVAAAQDPALMRRLADDGVPLTMCPLSNLELQVTPDLKQHPLKRLLDAGLVVTVNSDDPAYFDGYLLDNYLAVERALGLSRHDLAQLARNSITASLLPDERKAALIEEIDLAATGT